MGQPRPFLPTSAQQLINLKTNQAAFLRNHKSIVHDKSTPSHLNQAEPAWEECLASRASTQGVGTAHGAAARRLHC